METENEDYDYVYMGPSKVQPPTAAKTKMPNKPKTAPTKLVSKSTTKSTPSPTGSLVPTCSVRKCISAVSIVAVLILITCLSIVIHHHIHKGAETDHKVHEKSTNMEKLSTPSNNESRSTTTKAKRPITIDLEQKMDDLVTQVVNLTKRMCNKDITDSRLSCSVSRGPIGKANQTAASLLKSIKNENWTNYLTKLFYTGSLIHRVDRLSKDSSVSNQGLSKTPLSMIASFNETLANMIYYLNSERHLFEYFDFNGTKIESFEDDDLLFILGIMNTSDIQSALMGLIDYTRKLTPVVVKMNEYGLILVNQSISFAKEVINVPRYQPLVQWILDHPCWLTELPQHLAFYQSNAERLFVEYLTTALIRGKEEKFDDYKKLIFWDRPALVKILKLQLLVCKIVLDIPTRNRDFIEKRCFLQNYL